MTLRSRAALAERPAPVSKGFGTGVPLQIEAAEARAQMTPTSPFSPGEPIGPYDGFSRTPRSHDFVAGYNISARPRTHEAVAFSTLKGLIGSYDVARICIRHRIASLRSLDWKLVAADGWEGDISAEVAEGKRVLKRPDTKTLFKPWLSKYLRGVLSYDAGTLYRMRNRAGRAVGLSVVDGTMIAPLQDYWGNPPDDPAPAYVQYVQGLPWNWLTRSDLIYEPYDPQDDSLYGTAPLEDILLNANTDIRFQLYFLERFTSGNLPAGFASSPDTWSPDQIEQFQEYWDAFMLGDQTRKHQIRWIPSGSKLAWTNEKDFTDAFSLFLMRKTCLDEQTEILTRRGWVGFPKLADGDEVATRSADGRFEWQKPTDHIAEPYNGDMVAFKSNSLDLLVTPDHRMLLTYFPTKKHPRPKEFIKTAGEIVGKGGYMIPMRSSWEGRSPENFVLPAVSYTQRDRGPKGTFTTVTRPELVIPMKTWVAFLGLWLAEGHVGGSKGGARLQPGNGKYAPTRTYKVGISQAADSPYFGEMQELLDSLPFNWCRNTADWVCQDMRLHAYLVPLGNSFGKYIPEDIKDLSPEMLEILWAWACKGDGHHYLGKSWHMLTASQRLADDWQEILQKCGRDASVSPRKPSDGGVIRGKLVTNCKPTWIVRERTSPLRTAHGQVTPYEGMVYCVSVPNGVIYVRRNGRPAWVGNCSAYSIVPSDLGFTESVNKSSGESQADVQHRVGDLPMAMHIQEILTDFLQEDLQLPLKFSFDLGEEQDDRLNQAQSDDIYVKNGTVSSSEVREWRFGITDPEPVPRFLWTERSGPIPLSAMLAVAGPIDPATAAPAENAQLPHKAFAAVEGVLPNPPVKVPGLAVQQYGPEADPAAAAAAAAAASAPVTPSPPPPPASAPAPAAAPVAKEGEGAAPAGNVTAGITAATGLYSYDLDGRGGGEDDDDGPVDQATVAKEMQAFRRYSRARRRSGEWRDFEFRAVAKVAGHNLNDSGRLAVRKDAGGVAVAGLAVLAADTGRVLMLQRALDDSDPAAGMWEFPGGHLEGDESPLAAAWREWQEETGSPCAPGVQTGSWASGIYQGIVWTVEREAMVPVRSDSMIANPDDPDGDQAEAIAWWDPETIPGNPAVRPELLASIDDVMAALGYDATDDAIAEPESVAKCAFCPDCGGDLDDNGACMDWLERGERARQRAGIDGTSGDAQDVPHPFAAEGCHVACAACGLDEDAPIHRHAGIAKAGGSGPKAPAWHGWKLDQKTAAHWAPKVRDSVKAAIPKAKARDMGRDYLADHPEQDGKAPGKRDRNKAAEAWIAAWLARQGITLVAASSAEAIAVDGYAIGAISAANAVTGQAPPKQSPGDTDGALSMVGEAGLLAVLYALLRGEGESEAAAEAVAERIAAGYARALAIILAGADANWADSQDTLDELGDLLSDALADEDTAVTLVGTQINIYTGLSAHDYYMQNSVAWGIWTTAEDQKVCPVCLANAAQGPVLMGEPYQSGDVMPPAHPGGCIGRCAVIPSSPLGA